MRNTPQVLLVVDKPAGALSRLVPGLRRSGWTVSVAHSAAEARRRAAAEEFHAVLVGADFWSVARKLRRLPRTKSLPLLLVVPPQPGPRLFRSPVPADELLFPPLPLRKVQYRLNRLLLREEAAQAAETMQARVQALARIARFMRSESDDVAILHRTARELEQLMPGVTCSVVLLAEDQPSGYVITHGGGAEELNIQLELAKYPELRKVIETKQTVAIPDVGRHPLMKEVHKFFRHKPLQSVLAAPILYRDEVIGLLFLRSEKQRRKFSPAEIEFLELVANTTAAALKNLRLARNVLAETRGRQKAEADATRLAQLSRRLEALFAHASDGILVVSREGLVTDVNRNFLRLSGYDLREAVGRRLEELLRPEPAEGAPALSELLSGGRGSRSVNAVLICRDDSERQVSARLEPLPGLRGEYLISLLDVTEERRLSAELRRTKEFLEKVIQGTMDAIIAADLHGNIILFNEGAERISGYRAEEVIGKINIVDFYTPGVARDVMRKLRSPDYGGVGKLETCSNTIIGKNGEEIPINMSASIIYDEAGREIASVGIFHDLRDRIQIEKELRQAQERLMESRRREALVALAGAAAHQLNQPLTSILGYAEILKRVERSFYEVAPHHPALASLKNAVQAIAESAERMAVVVRKIGETAEFKTQTYLGGAQIVDLDQAGGPAAASPDTAYLEAVMDICPDPILVIGEDTIINRSNPAGRRLAGEDPTGHSFTRYLQGIAHVQGMAAFEKVRQGQRVEFELTITRPASGEPRRIGGTAIPIAGRNEFLLVLQDLTEIRRAEQEQRWLSALKDQVLDQELVPLITLDLDGRITFWNQACEKQVGYSAGEVTGRLLTGLLAESSQAAFSDLLQRLRQEGRSQGRIAFRRPDGSTLELGYFGSWLDHERGGVPGYSLLLVAAPSAPLALRPAPEEAREPSEALSRRSRLLEELIRVSRETPLSNPLPQLLETFCRPLLEVFPRAHLSIAFRPPQGRRFHYSYLGNLPREFLGRPVEISRELEQDLARANGPLRLRPDDPRLPTLLSDAASKLVFPLLFEHRLLGVMTFESHRDPAFSLTDLALLNLLSLHLSSILGNYYLYQQRDLWRGFWEKIIENANALILILDRRGRVVVFNRAFCELAGRPREQVLGRTLDELFQQFLRVEPELSFAELQARVLRGEALVNQRIHLQTMAGQEVEAVFNTATLRDGEGRFQGFVAIGQNITRLRQLEAQIVHSEKLASLGQMAASIAHELNNPLTAISSYVQILLRQTLPDKTQERLKQILVEADRIERLIRNLTSYARPSRAEMGPVALSEVMEQALALSSYEIGRGKARVELRLPADLPLVWGVKDQLQQVFINLLTNASYACGEKGGGQVVVSAGRVAGERVEVKVSDTGIGILPEHQSKIFEPFFTTKPEGKGTGLGLSIVKEIIARHEGEIQMESRPGEGTVFTVLLPVAGRGRPSGSPEEGDHS